jgi:hypothetical protein
MNFLIVPAVLRDLIVTRRLRPAYRYVLPAIIVGQVIAMHLFLTVSLRWVSIADAILR